MFDYIFLPLIRPRVTENWVLRRICGPKMDAVTREWRKLHYEELDDLDSSPNNVRVIKSRRVRWVGHIACLEVSRTEYRVLLGRPDERNHREELSADGRKLLKWIFKKWDREAWTTLLWFRRGSSAGRL